MFQVLHRGWIYNIFGEPLSLTGPLTGPEAAAKSASQALFRSFIHENVQELEIRFLQVRELLLFPLLQGEAVLVHCPTCLSHKETERCFA